jgi:hypothetical protein
VPGLHISDAGAPHHDSGLTATKMPPARKPSPGGGPAHDPHGLARCLIRSPLNGALVLGRVEQLRCDSGFQLNQAAIQIYIFSDAAPSHRSSTTTLEISGKTWASGDNL